MSKHTPGPWKASKGPQGWMVVGQDPSPVSGKMYPRPVAYMAGGFYAQTNAHLIAAAPKMLETLRGIVKRHDRLAAENEPCPLGESGEFTCGCADCRDALAAIAIAEEES